MGLLSLTHTHPQRQCESFRRLIYEYGYGSDAKRLCFWMVYTMWTFLILGLLPFTSNTRILDNVKYAWKFITFVFEFPQEKYQRLEKMKNYGKIEKKNGISYHVSFKSYSSYFRVFNVEPKKASWIILQAQHINQPLMVYLMLQLAKHSGLIGRALMPFSVYIHQTMFMHSTRCWCNPICKQFKLHLRNRICSVYVVFVILDSCKALVLSHK